MFSTWHAALSYQESTNTCNRHLRNVDLLLIMNDICLYEHWHLQDNTQQTERVVPFRELFVTCVYTPAPRRERGVYCFTSVRLSFRSSKIFFSVTVDGRNLIFGHKCHIRQVYHIVGSVFGPVRFLLPVCRLFIHIEHIYTFFITFFSATIDGRNLIFGHKLHIGTPYRGKRCWTQLIPTSCLPTFYTH